MRNTCTRHAFTSLYTHIRYLYTCNDNYIAHILVYDPISSSSIQIGSISSFLSHVLLFCIYCFFLYFVFPFFIATHSLRHSWNSLYSIFVFFSILHFHHGLPFHGTIVHMAAGLTANNGSIATASLCNRPVCGCIRWCNSTFEYIACTSWRWWPIQMCCNQFNGQRWACGTTQCLW